MKDAGASSRSPTPGNILDRILAERRADALTAARSLPVDKLLPPTSKRTHHSLSENLRSRRPPRIVAETKKASPSAGVLVADYDPADIARQYERAGAVAISVLTEPRHFLGSGEHVKQVREAVRLPILRKDFVVDPYQIYEAAAWGADVVLLIVAALDDRLLRDLHGTAVKLGLETIVEVHTASELTAALACDGAIIGVNNRNLATLKTDLAVARALAPLIPDDRLAIAESGISTAAQIEELQSIGYDGFLIGESLLKGGKPGESLKQLLRTSSVQL